MNVCYTPLDGCTLPSPVHLEQAFEYIDPIDTNGVPILTKV